MGFASVGRSLVVVLSFVFVAMLNSAALAAPDAAFTRAHEQWIARYVDKVKANTGRYLSAAENSAARCRAIGAWRQANTGGEKKLELEALIRMRRLSVQCPSLANIALGVTASNI